MNKLLSFTFCAKSELNSLRNNGITMKLPLHTFFGCSDTVKSQMTSYLNNGYDVMNCFAKFEKFLPHSITIPSL